MNLYVEMSQKLEQDIQEVEAYLVKLKLALAAIQPLITVDVPSQRALKYEPRQLTAPMVEEVDSVEAALPRPKAKRRVKASPTPRAEQVVSDIEPKLTAPHERKSARKRGAVRDSANTGGVASVSGPTVPATSREFFASILGARARTMPELVARAMAKLSAPEGSEAVITNRLSAWLYPAIKAGLAEQSGVKGKLKAYRLADGKG